MQWSDSQNSYGLMSRLNHWLGAVLVIVLLAIGLYFHEMPKGDERSYWQGLHIGIGALAFIFLAFRIVWRILNRTTQAAQQAPLLQKISHLTHVILVLGILIMIVSGPLIIWSAGRPINVFDWFSIASPMARMESLHEFLEEVHEIVSRVLLVLIIVHVLAAIKHAIMAPQLLSGRMWGRPD